MREKKKVTWGKDHIGIWHVNLFPTLSTGPTCVASSFISTSQFSSKIKYKINVLFFLLDQRNKIK